MSDIFNLKLEHLCDKTSKLLQDLGMFYRLERIHKLLI